MAGAVRVLAGLLMALLAGCEGGGGRAPADAPSFDRFVLVTLDTLRADHLGAYGYPFGTSPFLDSLAERSVVFERAYAAMATTVPSHASIFTSLYPIQHRVLKNGLALPGDYATLAELLAQAGFATGAFASTSAHFGVGGLDRGFATFDEPPPPAPGAPPYRPAFATVDAALRWLAAFEPGDRFFLWLHLYDTHQPLQPPEAHRLAVAPRTQAEHAARARFLHDEHHIPRGGVTPRGFAVFRRGDRGMVALHSSYDGEVHFMDAELGRLFEAFRGRGLASGTLWILTSDHGEGLGSHDYKFHGKHIYDEQVRIPLIFHSQEPALAPRRIDTLVEHVDLLPTLADLVGRGADLGARMPPIQGHSLVPLLTGKPSAAWPERSALVQRRSYAEEDRLSPLVDRDFELGSKFALVERRWKYIHRSHGDDELYDLSADPFETRNLVAREAARAAEMQARLLERVRQLVVATGPDAEAVDSETIERLRALGYAP
jgi:arylsulfatase A-like enzyme